MHRRLLLLLLLLLLAPLTSGQKRASSGGRKAHPGFELHRVDMGAHEMAQGELRREFKFTNISQQPVRIAFVRKFGPDVAAFRLECLTPPLTPGGPTIIAPGATTRVAIYFTPQRLGLHRMLLRIGVADPRQITPDFVSIDAVGMGPIGDELRLNVGGASYDDQNLDNWAQDFGKMRGGQKSYASSVGGTLDPSIFQSQVVGHSVGYSLPLVNKGAYLVTLHFAEMEHIQSGSRIFDVEAEGQLVVDDLDLFAVAGAAQAYQVSFVSDVIDDRLTLWMDASVGQACLAGVEIQGIPDLRATPVSVDFGAVESGGAASINLHLDNFGVQDLVIDTVSFRLGGSGNSLAYSLDLGGVQYSGQSGDVTYGVALGLAARASLDATLQFAPSEERYDKVVLELAHSQGILSIPLQGLGGHSGDPFLHPELETPAVLVDYDGDGMEPILLDGSGSHTHEPGRILNDWVMTVNGVQVSQGAPVFAHNLPQGFHALELEIFDDGVPRRRLSAYANVDVVPADRIPGVIALYHPVGAGQALSLLDGPFAAAQFAEVLNDLTIPGGSSLGGSSLTTNVVVRLQARIGVPASNSYLFVPQGGAASSVFLDGTSATSARTLAPGLHDLEVRFAVDSLGDAPLSVLVSEGGAAAAALDITRLFHDESSLVPVINSMPSGGSILGGNLITISGQGFVPSGAVEVHWGALVFDASDFTTLTATKIEFSSPAMAAGSVQVAVVTPQGTSNAMDFAYSQGGPVPLAWRHDHDHNLTDPVAAAWGPDGLLYVVSLDGSLTAVDFSDDYSTVTMNAFPGVSQLYNHDTLGIAINPYDEYVQGDPSKPVRVYLSHGKHFANGGSSFAGSSSYDSQVSLVSGPLFDAPQAVITGLPGSNHDHSINGIEFDNDGNLLILLGSNTNAGVPFPTIGDLPESPFSGALLLAKMADVGFNGAVQYSLISSGQLNQDQVFGKQVQPVVGVDVEVYSSGTRNPLDLVLSTRGYIYSTDNGPNLGFGAASTGPITEIPDPDEGDELLLLEHGIYYGHPNRSRGAIDARQNVYYPSRTGAHVPGVFRQAMQLLSASTNGIDEYRSDVFKGRMRGDLIVQRWYGNVQRVELSDDGRRSLSLSNLQVFAIALGIITAPGGTLIGIDYSGGRLRIIEPVDASASGLEVHDIFPWRAPLAGGARFEIGGIGFGTLADTTVSIGGQAASLTRVSSTRIEGVLPPALLASPEMLDVVVTVGSSSDTHAAAFRYLMGPNLEPGRWEAHSDLPVAMGEVSSAAIDGVLYVLGEGSSQTLAFDLMNRVWLPSVATRPHVGHHHAAEVLGGKLYLIGGLEGNSEGRVQIYDPVADSWSLGADLPWSGGSLSSAVINGQIYVSGGIVSTYTVNNCARYDPALDQWSALQAMPSGRNHAASGTDGNLFYVFGGRRGGNFVTNGMDDVMVYDPQQDTWAQSSDPLSGLAPLPVGRGGMGRAIYSRGEFYVFGGETLDDVRALPGTRVFDRVDVYNPETGSWRLEAPMSVPRHGLAPVLFEAHIFLPGGGLSAGFGQSTAFDDFTDP